MKDSYKKDSQIEQYKISISEAEVFTTMSMNDEWKMLKNERAEYQANLKKLENQQ